MLHFTRAWSGQVIKSVGVPKIQHASVPRDLLSRPVLPDPLFATHPSRLQRISVYKAFHLSAPGKQQPRNSMLMHAGHCYHSHEIKSLSMPRNFIKFQPKSKHLPSSTINNPFKFMRIGCSIPQAASHKVWQSP